MLASLDLAAEGALLAVAERLTLVPGDVVARDGSILEWFVFPETAPVMIAIRIDDVAQDVGLIGCDGMVGWSRLLDDDASRFDATASFRPGTAMAVPVAALQDAIARNPLLLVTTLGFAQRFTLQVARTLCASMRDAPLRRIARLILMLDDRIDGGALPVTHAALAATLNLRRATVTDTLHVLEGERLLRCTRGRIAVRDRAGLERSAGGAYTAADGLMAFRPERPPPWRDK